MVTSLRLIIVLCLTFSETLSLDYCTQRRLIEYPVEDILTIRKVAMKTYQSREIEKLNHVGEVYDIGITGKRLARIYQENQLIIIGYEGLDFLRWPRKLLDSKPEMRFDDTPNAGAIYRIYGEQALHARRGILEVLGRENLNQHTIIFTGFGSAAAIATLSAIDIQKELISSKKLSQKGNIKVVTFCSDVPANREFAENYKNEISLWDTLSFVSHNNFPLSSKDFSDYGYVGIPIRILPSEAWRDLINNKKIIMAQGATALVGISLITALSLANNSPERFVYEDIMMPVLKIASGLITTSTLYSLPFLLGVDPYGAPSKTTIKSAFKAATSGAITASSISNIGGRWNEK